MDDIERPLCKCHGLPMTRNSYQRNGNIKWACKIVRRTYSKRFYEEGGGRERMRTEYEQRVHDEVCVRCKGPLTSDRLCWKCLNYLEQNARYRIHLGR